MSQRKVLRTIRMFGFSGFSFNRKTGPASIPSRLVGLSWTRPIEARTHEQPDPMCAGDPMTGPTS